LTLREERLTLPVMVAFVDLRIEQVTDYARLARWLVGLPLAVIDDTVRAGSGTRVVTVIRVAIR
jgi:hypothetical protein